MTLAALAAAIGRGELSPREALEAHFIVCRIVQAKSKWVAVAGVLTLAGMLLAGVALVSKLV